MQTLRVSASDCKRKLYSYEGFPKFRGIFGGPITKIIVLLGLYWGPAILVRGEYIIHIYIYIYSNFQVSGDQNPSYSKKKGAFRNKVWRKQSAVFRKGS